MSGGYDLTNSLEVSSRLVHHDGPTLDQYSTTPVRYTPRTTVVTQAGRFRLREHPRTND